MPDTMEATRQDMEQEAADELLDRERHDLLPVRAVTAVVLVAEGDAALVEGDHVRALEIRRPEEAERDVVTRADCCDQRNVAVRGLPQGVRPADEDDVWKGKDDQVKYLPLQAQEGDLAIFLQKGAIEVLYEDEKYFIVPQASILMLEREEEL